MMLRISNKELMIERENLTYRIKEKEEKEKELKTNLEAINKKV